MEIELGCWTRPWWDFTLQEALRGIAAAGFPIVGIAPFDDGPVFSADSTEEEIARLKAAVESHGLLPQVVFGNPDLSRELEEAVLLFQREIERVQRLGLPYMVLLGTADEDQYEKWYSAVERCLDFAGERAASGWWTSSESSRFWRRRGSPAPVGWSAWAAPPSRRSTRKRRRRGSLY